MRTPPIPAAELLRSPEQMREPDARAPKLAFPNMDALTVHHANIARIKVSEQVPEDVAIQFETARNLYLYAWHVYRFYMVAELQALVTLEFGLRKRLPERLPAKYQRPHNKTPMLAGLLAYAMDQGLIRNEGFGRWHEAAARQARQRRSMEAIQTLIDQKLYMIEVDDTQPLVITPEDQNWDLLGVLRDGLPATRNDRAHGGSELRPQVSGTIELVAEILNQVYASPG
jgi:hypothetical protein